jgi:Bacterial membrane protein YfhO
MKPPDQTDAPAPATLTTEAEPDVEHSTRGRFDSLVPYAGPALILLAVLIVLHGFWLHPKLSNEHPDLLPQWLAWYGHLGTSLRQGHIPSWLPYQFAGMPFAADPQKGWMYLPAMALFGTFGPARALGLLITLQPALAGLGMYWFFRNERVGRVAATVGGLTLAMTMANSAIAITLPFAGLFAWLAIALAAASGYVHSRSRTGMAGWVLLLAFALSQVAAAHLSNGLLFAGFVIAIFLAVRLRAQFNAQERRAGEATVLFFVPFVAFPLLGAAVLLPSLSFLPRSSIGHGYVGMADLTTKLTGIRSAPAFAPGFGPWWGSAFARGPAGYSGALGLLVLPSAFGSKRWRIPAVAFGVVGFLGWLLQLDAVVKLKPLRDLARKSSLGQLWLHGPYRFRYLTVIAVAALAGYGVQAWLDAGRMRDRRGRLMAAAPLLAVVLVYVVWPIAAGNPASQFAFFAVGAAYSVALLWLLRTERVPSVVAFVLPVLLAVELTVAGLIQQRGPVPAETRLRLDRPPASGFGTSFPSYHTPFIDARAYLTPGPIGRALLADRGAFGRYLSFDPRINNSSRGFLPAQDARQWAAYEDGRSVLFGIDEVQGYSPVQVDPYWQLVRRSRTHPIFYNSSSFDSIDPQVLQLFGVRWLILPEGEPPPPLASPDPVAAEGRWRLYRVSNPQTRASVVYSVQRVPPGGGLDRVLELGFDPAKEAVLESGVAAGFASNAGGNGTASYEEASPQSAEISVTTSAPGLLVVRNVFDRNWRATVDGHHAEVLRTDFALQGVVLPAGTHRVELRYVDTGVRLGLLVSAGSWLVALGLIVWFSPWRRRRLRGVSAGDEIMPAVTTVESHQQPASVLGERAPEGAAAGPSPPRRKLEWPVRTLVVIALGVVAWFVGFIYLTRYNPRDLSPVGWDIHAYVWQTKALGHASLSAIGARPGMPLLAGTLRSIVPIDAARELVVLPPVLALALGMALAAAVRMALRLPLWTLPVIAVIVAVWPSTRRGVYGYEAALTHQVVLAAGIALIVHARTRRATLGVAAALFVAACLSHLLFYALFAGVAGLELLPILPRFWRDWRGGEPLLDTEVGSTVAAVGAGAVIGAAGIFGWLRIRPSDTGDVQTVSFLYRARTVQAVNTLRPRVFGPVGVVGAAFGILRPSTRAGRSLLRLAVAWLVVVGGGLLLSLLRFPVPGARFLQFALPIPVLFGLGMSAAVWGIARRPNVLRVALAVFVVALFVLSPMQTRIRQIEHNRHVRRSGAIWDQVRSAASYVGRVPGKRPVIFVVNSSGANGAYTPKVKSYILRSGMPADAIGRTFIYIGEVANLQSSRPTLIANPKKRWQKSYNALSLKNWEKVLPELEDDPIVLITKQYAGAEYEKATAADFTRQVAPGLYVVRGPVFYLGAPAAEGRFPLRRGAATAVAFLLILILVGWGWTRWATSARSAGTLDVLCLAPAVGAGMVIVAAFGVAAVGANPAGWLGIVMLAALAASGAWLALRPGRTAGRPEPTEDDEDPLPPERD